jgi:hypothetical protein
MSLSVDCTLEIEPSSIAVPVLFILYFSLLRSSYESDSCDLRERFSSWRFPSSCLSTRYELFNFSISVFFSYLIGTSNIQGIDETKLTHAAKVTKFTAYTLEETINCISRLVQEPNIIVLHVLTNDLKTKSPQLCANQLSDVVSSIFEKWCTVKIVVSLTTPRNDSILHNTNGQIINALVKQNLSDRNVVLVDHSNMCSGGNPIPDLLSNDHYHLSAKGVAQLASNIKRAIHSILGVPLPVRQPHHSRSRSRRGRGRGLLQGGCGK